MSKRKIFLFLFFTLFLLLNKERPQKTFKEKIDFPYFEAKVFVEEPKTFQFFQNSFLVSQISPIQIFQKSFATLSQRKEIIEYEVQPGDNIASLSQKFGISEETIILANNLSKNSGLKAGEKILILPVDGILHQVQPGETLSQIAKLYKANLKEIIAFNEIELDEKGNPIIFPGEVYLIPGGKMPRLKPSFQNLPSISSNFFICPLPPCNITQSLHWYNAVDFSNGKCGEYVLAAASGKVIFAKYGWNGGFGNTVKILHSNQVITQYSHLREILVKVGDEVLKGDIIGTVGNTGKVIGVTGCHLHFAVLGAQNPFGR